MKFSLKKWAGKEAVFTFTATNLLNRNYVPTGWTYAFRSANYDPVPDDPYAGSEGGGAYHLTGLFPQAGRGYLASIRIGF